MTDSTKLIERLKEAARAATPQDLDTAQSADHYTDGRWIECPACGGEGSVELHADFCNYDGKAIGVQFYGIGPEHLAAEAYFRVASPAAILELIALIEQQAAQIAALESAAKATMEKDWRVGPFKSSSDPRREVRCLADGINRIAEYEKHHSFIRWIAAAPAATDNGGGRDAEELLLRSMRLEACALKYLDYLGIADAKTGLEKDLLDPDMVGAALSQKAGEKGE